MQATPRATKARRSHAGCNTCRARKVKCDERQGVCANCERLDLDCSGSNDPSEQIFNVNGRHSTTPNIGSGGNEVSKKRKRTYRSCTGCRSSKNRCSGDKPSCLRCRQKGLECIWEEDSVPAWTRRLASVTPQVGGNPIDTVAARDEGGEEHREIGHSAIEASDVEHGERRLGTRESLPSWLTFARLPDAGKIRLLVEQYFKYLHPLRCFAFIHKPSFLQRIDNEVVADHNENALVCIICALGAQLYAVEYSNKNEDISHKGILSAGNQWAKTAQEIILANLGDISVENLMAAVLLHDHELRIGNYANAFMISGLTARMAQALQINLEYSTDVLCRDIAGGPSASDRESRRRLAWSCYILDTLVGSGVDQLTLFDERDIKIQLPCDERSFLLQLPCITQTLEEGEVLRFLPPESVPPNTAENLGMMAHFIRHMKIRRKMLRYIKRLNTAKDPWLPNSEFVLLDAECRRWYETLPNSLKFTPASIYIRKETNQIGALCLLHLAYQNTMCDLYRIGAPALYKLRGAFEFPPEQQGFLNHLQSVLYEHGKSVALITIEAMRHGPNTLADSWIPSIIYDASRIMLYHVTQLIDPAKDSSKATILETAPLLKSNIKALKMMRSLCSIANPLYSAAEAMLEKAGLGSDFVPSSIVPYEPYPPDREDSERSSVPGTPAQSAPDYVLNPLSIYRMARKAIPEKHEPEKIASPANIAQNHSTPAAQHIAARTQEEPCLNNAYDPNAAEQAAFDEFQMFLTSDPGWQWQPAETATGSVTDGALPPWMPIFR